MISAFGNLRRRAKASAPVPQPATRTRLGAGFAGCHIVVIQSIGASCQRGVRMELPSNRGYGSLS